MNLFRQLIAINASLQQLAELVDDTLIGVGSDAYARGLIVYQQAKLAGKGTPLERHLDQLGQRFARRAAGPADRPTTTP